MSLQPERIGPIPEETARVARAAFPDSTTAMRVRDELGTIYRDEAFVALFSSRGRPAEAPWRLALA
jgi:transposase